MKRDSLLQIKMTSDEKERIKKAAVKSHDGKMSVAARRVLLNWTDTVLT